MCEWYGGGREGGSLENVGLEAAVSFETLRGNASVVDGRFGGERRGLLL
jgi:hypothetical protein